MHEFQAAQTIPDDGDQSAYLRMAGNRSECARKISLPACYGINDAKYVAVIEIVIMKAREVMDKASQYLISKDNGKLQITYEEYMVLMEKAEEANRVRKAMDEVLADLENFLRGSSRVVPEEQIKEKEERIAVALDSCKSPSLK